jgi:hypothetical protein
MGKPVPKAFCVDLGFRKLFGKLAQKNQAEQAADERLLMPAQTSRQFSV